MKYDVFISYSREDYVDENKNIIPGNIVSKVKDLLAKHNYKFWFDEEGIYSGDAFVETITEAIQDSEIFLFISTKNSNRSKWTNHEIATAKLLGKKTIPFKVDDTIYNKSILMYLAPLDYIDYAKNPDKAFDALLLSLNHHYAKIREKELKLKEEENRKLREKEKEDALKAAQKKRQQRLCEIEEEIVRIKSSINECEAESSKLTEKIYILKEQIVNYEYDLNTIDNNRKALYSSMQILEQEKKSLFGLNIAIDGNKQEKNPNRFASSLKVQVRPLAKKISSIILGKDNLVTLWKWFRQLGIRYYLHLLLLLILAFICFLGILHTEELLFALFVLLPFLVAIIGIIQLLKGEKDGFVTLLLNVVAIYGISYFVGLSGLVGSYGFIIMDILGVTLLFLLHKSDRSSNLSWSKMRSSRLKHPKKVLSIVLLCLCVVSFAVPYAYAKYCGLNEYSILESDELLNTSLYGVIDGSHFAANEMGDSYMPGYDGDFNLQPNIKRALWWYRLANNTKRMNLCQQYIKAQEYGYYESEVYGKCGINKINSALVRISVDSYKSSVEDDKITYSGGRFYDDFRYYISLDGADTSQGEFKVEGASWMFCYKCGDGYDGKAGLVKDTRRFELYDIQGDSVVMRFVQEGVTISERIIPVTKTTPIIIVRDGNGERLKEEEGLYEGNYTVQIIHPREDAMLRLYVDAIGRDITVPVSSSEVSFSIREDYIEIDGHKYELRKYYKYKRGCYFYYTYKGEHTENITIIHSFSIKHGGAQIYEY